MSALTDARHALAEALGAIPNVTVYPTVPEALDASPALIVQPAESWVLPAGETFAVDEHLLTFEVYAAVELISNEQAADDLDDLLDDLLAALPAGYEVAGVARPGPIRTASWYAHGMAVTVTTLITLT